MVPALIEKGQEVVKLVRKETSAADEIQWDSQAGFTADEAQKLEGFDSVIHLAGVGVAEQNWSEAYKKQIRDSRVVGTRVLVDALNKTKSPPKHFISASAIGFYGNRGDEVITEESKPGKGFMPDICIDWEAETKKAAKFADRVLSLRIGIVLAKGGGALDKMLTPFSYGLGGVIGSGKQYMPWITIDDLVEVFLFALANEEVSGAVNAVAPNPVTNQDFTTVLGKVLQRPTLIPVPEFAVRLMFGEMGDNLLLQGNRVIPRKLEQMGFRFEFPDLEAALTHVLKD